MTTYGRLKARMARRRGCVDNLVSHSVPLYVPGWQYYYLPGWPCVRNNVPIRQTMSRGVSVAASVPAATFEIHPHHENNDHRFAHPPSQFYVGQNLYHKLLQDHSQANLQASLSLVIIIIIHLNIIRIVTFYLQDFYRNPAFSGFR